VDFFGRTVIGKQFLCSEALPSFLVSGVWGKSKVVECRVAGMEVRSRSGGRDRALPEAMAWSSE